MGKSIIDFYTELKILQAQINIKNYGTAERIIAVLIKEFDSYDFNSESCRFNGEDTNA